MRPARPIVCPLCSEPFVWSATGVEAEKHAVAAGPLGTLSLGDPSMLLPVGKPLGSSSAADSGDGADIVKLTQQLLHSFPSNVASLVPQNRAWQQAPLASLVLQHRPLQQAPLAVDSESVLRAASVGTGVPASPAPLNVAGVQMGGADLSHVQPHDSEPALALAIPLSVPVGEEARTDLSHIPQHELEPALALATPLSVPGRKEGSTDLSHVQPHKFEPALAFATPRNVPGVHVAELDISHISQHELEPALVLATPLSVPGPQNGSTGLSQLPQQQESELNAESMDGPDQAFAQLLRTLGPQEGRTGLSQLPRQHESEFFAENMNGATSPGKLQEDGDQRGHAAFVPNGSDRDVPQETFDARKLDDEDAHEVKKKAVQAFEAALQRIVDDGVLRARAREGSVGLDGGDENGPDEPADQREHPSPGVSNRPSDAVHAGTSPGEIVGQGAHMGASREGREEGLAGTAEEASAGNKNQGMSRGEAEKPVFNKPHSVFEDAGLESGFENSRKAAEEGRVDPLHVYWANPRYWEAPKRPVVLKRVPTERSRASQISALLRLAEKEG
jgi:hypothetical protein